jgi:5-methylcytosine-specific restriction enzyme subunit McrC
MFRLEPDLLIEHSGTRWVLDTKWKRINASDRANNYGISQGDMYQLHAYGQKYLSGSGHIALVYPKSATFEQPLSCFHLSNQLKLWVLPFDLDTGQIIHSGQIPVPIAAAQHAILAA